MSQQNVYNNAARELQIPAALHSLALAIDNLNMTAGELVSRISPVLLRGTDGAAGKSGPAPLAAQRCGLAGEIEGQAECVRDVTEILMAALAALEL